MRARSACTVSSETPSNILKPFGFVRVANVATTIKFHRFGKSAESRCRSLTSHPAEQTQPRAPQLFIFAEVIAANATNEAVAFDFALHAQRAIPRLSQTVTFPHPYNYWGSVVSLSECPICSSKSGVAPAMFIAETPIVAFACESVVTSDFSHASPAKGDGQLVWRIMIRRHESSGWRVTPAAFAL
jgi:hypothetical protein